jgi:hypothetical protein
MTIENSETNCLTHPGATIPLIMPLKKPYSEHFSVLSFNFPPWWKAQLDDMHNNRMPFANTIPVSNPIFMKMVVIDKEIWFTYNYSLARYDTRTSYLKQYEILDTRNQPFQISDIIRAHNGTLWALLNSPQPGMGYSVLGKYQPDNDTFNIVSGIEGVSSFSEVTFDDPSYNKLAELPDGQLAIVIGGKIYLFNPIKKHANLLVDSGNVVTIATGKDNKIWFANHYKDYNLLAVDSKNGTVVDFGVPPQLGRKIKGQPELLEATKAIAVDQQGHVWVSYYDRLELGPNGSYSWHSTKLLPLFVNTFDPGYKYRWANVFTTNIFSDGSIWFASDNGIIQYDTSNDNWCLKAEVYTFSNYPITEDSNGNIWTIVDRQIYKLESN